MTPPTTELAQPPVAAPAPAAPQDHVPKELWPRPEDYPNVHELVIEDGKPVDNIFSEKQMRLLTEPLKSGWSGPPGGKPFVVMADVGVFHTTGEPPIVPDALLAVGVTQGDLTQRENLAYFVWLRGKVPDVVVEIVSNREGGEDTDKLALYARIGVPYYIVFDPRDLLQKGTLRVYQRQGGTYQPLSRPWFFEEVGLGVDLWPGRYEDQDGTWLRWCERDGRFIPTGAERADQERQRAEVEQQRADTERQRADAEQGRADTERQRADAERQRAAQAEQRAAAAHQEAERLRQEVEQLKAQLRATGIEPPA